MSLPEPKKKVPPPIPKNKPWKANANETSQKVTSDKDSLSSNSNESEKLMKSTGEISLKPLPNSQGRQQFGISFEDNRKRRMSRTFEDVDSSHGSEYLQTRRIQISEPRNRPPSPPPRVVPTFVISPTLKNEGTILKPLPLPPNLISPPLSKPTLPPIPPRRNKLNSKSNTVSGIMQLRQEEKKVQEEATPNPSKPTVSITSSEEFKLMNLSTENKEEEKNEEIKERKFSPLQRAPTFVDCNVISEGPKTLRAFDQQEMAKNRAIRAATVSKTMRDASNSLKQKTNQGASSPLLNSRIKYKLCILGGQCGKSSYIYNFMENKFNEEESPTVEYTFHKKYKLDGTEYILDILDTSGDDTYATLHRKWYQYGQGFVFVCNLTSRLSVKELELLHQELETVLSPAIPPRIIVATGADLENRVVSKQELKELSSKLKCNYWEVSAKTGQKVEESFIGLLREIETYKLGHIALQTFNKSNKKKEREIINLDIPKYLVTRQQTFQKAFLAFNGTLIAQYKGTGTQLLYKVQSGFSTTKRLENTSPILNFRLKFPILVTYHENGILQAYNLETEALDQFESQNINPKEVQAIFLDNQLIYLLSLKKLYVYQIEYLNAEPLEILLNDPNGTITGFAEEFSSLHDNWLVLGTRSYLIIWELNLTTKSAKVILKEKSPSETEAFIKVYSYGSIVIGRTKSQTVILNLKENPISRILVAISNPSEIISAVYLDQLWLIIGNNFGLLQLYRLADGCLIHNLNKVDMPSKNNEEKLLLSMAKRVTCIERTGRLIWVGTENSKLFVYDMYKSEAPPLAEVSVKSLSVRSLAIDFEHGFCFAKIEKASSNKLNSENETQLPSVVIWQPTFPILELTSTEEEKVEI